MSDEAALRAAKRRAREDEALAAAIERAWIARFGQVAVVVAPLIAQLRRGDR